MIENVTLYVGHGMPESIMNLMGFMLMCLLMLAGLIVFAWVSDIMYKRNIEGKHED